MVMSHLFTRFCSFLVASIPLFLAKLSPVLHSDELTTNWKTKVDQSEATGNLERSTSNDHHHEGSCNATLCDEDTKVVMERLGLWNYDEEREIEREILCGTDELFEEKECSLQELEEAFEVFDIDGDGQITPDELRTVLKKLGFEEGMDLEECKAMIEAYDEDGDGRIGFVEFKSMMECII